MCEAPARAVAEGVPPGGWALDDGVGAVFADGCPAEAVTRRPGARLDRVETAAPGEPGRVHERPVTCRSLGAVA